MTVQGTNGGTTKTAGISITVNVAGGGTSLDDYPYKTSPFCPANVNSCPSDTVDPYGFYYRECTSFVAWRMNRDAGTTDASRPWFTDTMSGGRWGNAGNWTTNASTLGYRVDNTPSVGAMAQWNANECGGCTVGHVAYVESIHADGSVNVSEYNFLVGHGYGFRSNVRPPRYVHISAATQAAVSFLVSASPNSQTVTQGNSTTYTVTVQSQGGFNGGVALAVLNLPGNQVLSGTGFSPSTVTPAANGTANSTLTIVTNSSTPTGSFSMTVQGTNGGTTRTASISITVNAAASAPGGFTLSAAAPICDSGSPAVALNWTAASGATSYDLYRNGVQYSPGITGTTFYNSANLTAGQSYTYFVRARNSTGTTDSNTVSVSIPSNLCVGGGVTVPVAPSGLQAASASTSQINLSWTDDANNETGFKIERKTGAAGRWSEIATAAANVITYSDTGLAASTQYYYRVRASNSAGDSGYSNEASATTQSGGGGAALPESTHPYVNSHDNTWTYTLQMSSTAISVTFDAQTWVELNYDFIYVMDGNGTNIAGSPFTGTTLAGQTKSVPGNTVKIRLTSDVNITGWGFRVTAVAPGTVPKKTVFLIHGIAQRGGDLSALKNTLTQSVSRIDTSRFDVDDQFDWPCANNLFCRDSISVAGQELADYIARKAPTGDIILVGYSMGGLIARDMMLHNYSDVLSHRCVAAFVTLGTPHLGYSYLPRDLILRATGPSQDMAGDFRNPFSTLRFEQYPDDYTYAFDLFDRAGQRIASSSYLYNLNTSWTLPSSFGGMPRKWMAAGGRACEGTRTWDNARIDVFGEPVVTSTLILGCPETNNFSDGVVCDQSARFRFNADNRPQEEFVDFAGSYHHTGNPLTWFVLCAGVDFDTIPLFAPSPGSTLAESIKEFINAVQ
jgi:surface antigen/pimeloyl-ACP methyl ester carboxylesterase